MCTGLYIPAYNPASISKEGHAWDGSEPLPGCAPHHDPSLHLVLHRKCAWWENPGVPQRRSKWCAAFLRGAHTTAHTASLETHLRKISHPSSEYLKAQSLHREHAWWERPGSPGRRCERCGAFQRLRAHHCGACERCVDTHDHHCAWLGTCIGARNQCMWGPVPRPLLFAAGAAQLQPCPLC